ncbi:hypothetical protein L1887_29410 [Cichorium endivia]|nr:hypothetical protein L1887_29410 [Cichorium endivia]
MQDSTIVSGPPFVKPPTIALYCLNKCLDFTAIGVAQQPPVVALLRNWLIFTEFSIRTGIICSFDFCGI